MGVEIQLVLGFDEESERALSAALEAQKVLREEYGIWVTVSPRQLWKHDPVTSTVIGVPKLIINRTVVFEGRAPSVEEVVDAVIALMREGGEAPATLLMTDGRIDPMFMDAAYAQEEPAA